jgi:hypothetical protein
MTANRILRGRNGSKKEKVTGGLRNLHNKESAALNSISNMLRVSK